MKYITKYLENMIWLRGTTVVAKGTYGIVDNYEQGYPLLTGKHDVKRALKSFSRTKVTV